MKREQSTAARSFRVVALAIALVAIITVSTVAYSGFQEYEVFANRNSGVRISANYAVTGADISFRVNGTIPNNGFYPVQFELGYAATDNGSLVAEANLPTVTLPVGENHTFDASANVNVLQAATLGGLRTILLNSSTLTVFQEVNATVGPFAGLFVSSNLTTIQFAAPMGHLTLSRETRLVTAAGTSFSATVSFQNENIIPLPYSLYAEFYRAGVLVANTSAVSGIDLPSIRSSFVLTAETAQAVPAGTYTLILHIVVSGRNLPISVGVSLD